MGVPTRSCVACRKRAAKPALVRVAVAPSGKPTGKPGGTPTRTPGGGPARAVVTVDSSARLPGRGAYVCAERTCLDAALRRDGLALVRALRVRPEAAHVDAAQLRAQWQQVAAVRAAAEGDDGAIRQGESS